MLFKDSFLKFQNCCNRFSQDYIFIVRKFQKLKEFAEVKISNAKSIKAKYIKVSGLKSQIKYGENSNGTNKIIKRADIHHYKTKMGC